MAITYPLTLPVAPREVTLELRKSVGKAASEFTFQAQAQIHQGDIWLATFEYPPLERAAADELIGMLWSPEDMQFYLGPTGARKTPKGIATGTPLVKGAGQTGFTLLTDGWTAGQTNIMKRGDFLSFGGFLYCLAAPADSDGSGNATLELANRIRAATSDNDPITVNSPVGIFRLLSPRQSVQWNVIQHAGIVLEAEEVL